MSAEVKISEQQIKLAIAQRFCEYHDYMDPQDCVVHLELEIGNAEVTARVVWEPNIKRDEQSWEGQWDIPEDMSYGC